MNSVVLRSFAIDKNDPISDSVRQWSDDSAFIVGCRWTIHLDEAGDLCELLSRNGFGIVEYESPILGLPSVIGHRPQDNDETPPTATVVLRSPIPTL